MKRLLALAALLIGFSSVPVMAPAIAQDNRIDHIPPDPPELAAFGPNGIGVRTIEMVNPGQRDILKVEAGKPVPTYDRKLTVEVWYPADVPADSTGDYTGVFLRDAETNMN